MHFSFNTSIQIKKSERKRAVHKARARNTLQVSRARYHYTTDAFELMCW